MTPVKILSVALLLALAFAGLQWVRLADERAAHANSKTEHAEQRTQWERETRIAVEAARAKEQRRNEALQGVIDEAEKNLSQARADADAAGDAGERLRKRLAELTGACRVGAGDTAVADPGPAAKATGDLLSDVQRRLDEATDGIARFADQAHAAGKACEAGYGVLKPAPLSR